MSNTAIISACGLYRYTLTRKVDAKQSGKTACFIMLNPSTATATDDDATIRKLIGFSERLGFSEFTVVNLFAFRTKSPKVLKETGGKAYFPRFYGEFPSIFRDVSNSLRNQYMLTYAPTNQVRDGKYRKIKVELVNPATNEPLKVVDEKGKPIKYQVVAKQGYTAPREVE